MDSDFLDIMLMTKRECNAFQPPPVSSSRGHKAEDWRGKQMWKGFCKINQRGPNAVIQLINIDDTTFAECTVEMEYDSMVQRCYDSSRFFALLIKNPGNPTQKAMIGVGFDDRNDSFDFISCLDDFKR